MCRLFTLVDLIRFIEYNEFKYMQQPALIIKKMFEKSNEGVAL